MMGMDVHDMENFGEVWVGYDGQPKSTQFGRKSQRLAIPLEPGFVHTVEPGIYFIPELIDLWRERRSLWTSLTMIRWKNTATSVASAMRRIIWLPKRERAVWVRKFH